MTETFGGRMSTSVVTLSGLAARLRLPRRWLRQQAIAGRIPCLRVGRRFLFSPAAVEEALARLALGKEGVSRGP